jgi:hypothetical protein
MRMLCFPLARKDAEAVLEVILQGKPLRLGKTLPGSHRIAHPGQNESPHLPAVDVVAEAVPLVLDAGQVVRLDGAFLEGGSVEFLVLEFQDHALSSPPR